MRAAQTAGLSEKKTLSNLDGIIRRNLVTAAIRIQSHFIDSLLTTLSFSFCLSVSRCPAVSLRLP